MLQRLLKLFGVLLILAIAVLTVAWFYFDEEYLQLNATTRAQFNESFIEPESGTVHYELGGPASGESVVLVHGFSVPACIWDPTFEFLTSAGYRVLRFDLYGRGHSDRPDLAYTIESVAGIGCLNCRESFSHSVDRPERRATFRPERNIRAEPDSRQG